MSKQREALQVALEALEDYQANGAPFFKCDSAVSAIREALAAREIKELREAGDSVLLNEQAYLLRKCRAALDEILAAKPRLAAGYYECGHMKDTIGNLRAELYDYRPQGVFGIGDEE